MALGMSLTFASSGQRNITGLSAFGSPLGLTDGSREFEGAFPVRKPAVKLRLFDGEQDFLKTGSWRNPHALQVISRYQPGGGHLLGRGLGQKLLDEVVSLKAAMT